MAKPSIFSRDYEKKMKKRKRKIIIAIMLGVFLVLLIFFKFKVQGMDFTNIKAKIQAWVDSGKPNEELAEKEEKEEKEEIEKEPEMKVPEKTYMDLAVSEGIVVKAEYKEVDGTKKFVAIEPVEGVTYNISPSGQQMVIIDSKQNMKVFNINGNITDITKTVYISGAGSQFPKEQTLTANSSYTWHSQAKFIDETRILYVSNLPYFGDAAVNKYMWIYDLSQAADRAIFNLTGPDTTVGELTPDKGINVTVNGGSYYINGDGIITQ